MLQFPEHFRSAADIKRFHCSHCGELNPPDLELFQLMLDATEELRKKVDKPLILNSVWRCMQHSAERGKPANAIHAHYHAAVDIGGDHEKALLVLQHATWMPIWRAYGVSQRGGGRFIHLDLIQRPWAYDEKGNPTRALWGYP